MTCDWKSYRSVAWHWLGVRLPVGARLMSNDSGQVVYLYKTVVSVMDSGAEGPGSNRSRDAVG